MTSNAAAQAARRGHFPPILDLAEIRPGDLPLVGTKAYNLGMLLRAGFPVPGGFCITTSGFQVLRAKRRAAPSSHGPLREVILGAFRAAGIKVAAVRSSAAQEDLPDGSWAGVYTSILGISGERELIEAVDRCYRSIHGPVARLCRRQRGIGDVDGQAMAVLVQELVDAEAAGVLFTASPLTRSPLELHINAVCGLAEPLVSGRVSGDSFVVDRRGRVVFETISEKTTMLRRGGEVVVPGRDRNRPALDRRQIADLARLGHAVARFFGTPQDMEFAIEGGRIHLLQARPIPKGAEHTGLRRREVDSYLRRERQRLRRKVAGLRAAGRLRAREAVFSNGNIGELLCIPTPMSFGLFRHVFAGRNGAIVTGRRRLGYTLAQDATDDLYELVCGHAYFNLEIDAATFDMGLPLDPQGHVALILQDPQRANYPETGLYLQCLGRAEALRRFGPAGERHYRVARAFRRRMARHGEDFLRRFSAKIEPSLRERLAWIRKTEGRDLSPPALLQDIQSHVRHLQGVSCVQFVIAARIGFFFAEVVRHSLGDTFGESPQLWGRLLQGLPGSRITRQMIDLEKVAARRMSRAAFLRSYGHLAVNELEISLPRLSEEPASVQRMLHDLAITGRRPAAEFHCQLERRLALQSQLRRRLRRAGKAASDELFEALRLAQRFLPLRETLKYYYAAEYAAIRSGLLRLQQHAGLGAGDIFYLYPEELPQCLRPPPGILETIGRRRQDRKAASLLAREHRLPPVIFASRLKEMGRVPALKASRTLVGRAVASGAATGVVRIIDLDGVDTARIGGELIGDEILVTRSANLGLAPLLRIVAGLVVEVGGILAHAACQAREAGIPAVVVDSAMGLLRAGMTVKVDGDSGTVTVMGEAQ